MNDGIIVKTERHSSDRCRFFGVVRQQTMQSVVDEGKSPISWFKFRRDVIDLFGSQHMFKQTRCRVAIVR